MNGHKWVYSTVADEAQVVSYLRDDGVIGEQGAVGRKRAQHSVPCHVHQQEGTGHQRGEEQELAPYSCNFLKQSLLSKTLLSEFQIQPGAERLP